MKSFSYDARVGKITVEKGGKSLIKAEVLKM